MKYNEIIIEVKTKWIFKDNNYYRDIIEYTIDCKETDPKELAVKHINETNIKHETTDKIDSNVLTINLLDKNKNKIKISNDGLEYIKNYTKWQWEA